MHKGKLNDQVFFGIRKFWLWTALSSFGVIFTLNSVFIPMSVLCLAKMSWYSTRKSSTACFSYSVSIVFVQSNRSKNFVRESTAYFELSFSFSFISRSFLEIHVYNGVWISILPGFSRVVNQNMFFCCSYFFVLSNWLRWVVRSESPSWIILRTAMSTRLMRLVCSIVVTENSAFCVFF